MTPVKRQFRLAAHAQRGSVDHEIQATLAIIERKIGRFGEMREIHRMVLALRRKFVEQCTRFLWIAPRQHNSETMFGKRCNDRACCAARAKHPRHAEVVLLLKFVAQGLKKARCVGVEAGHSFVAADQCIHRSDPLGDRIEPVNQRDDRLFVRHGDVAAAPVGIALATGDIGEQTIGKHMLCTIAWLKPQLAKPEIVNRGAFGLRNRIADHFGVCLP